MQVIKPKIKVLSAAEHAASFTRNNRPSVSAASLATAAAALFGGTAYFSWRYARAHGAVPAASDTGAVDASRVFDQIADKYDDAIGQEEAAMWYGMMRKWLLKHARGDVLEVSVGTGRNFKYYDLDGGGIRSMTCTDLSHGMLLRAEDKFFDELELGTRHPDVRMTFCLADAHCLVDPKLAAAAPPPASSEAPATATVGSVGAARPPPATAGASLAPATGVATGQSTSEPPSYPWWAYWRHMPPSKPSTSNTERAAAAAEPLAGTASASTSAAAGASSSPNTNGQAPPPTAPPFKEMPGLHAGGLVNFLRVLVPGWRPPPAPAHDSPGLPHPAAGGASLVATHPEAAPPAGAGADASHSHHPAGSCCHVGAASCSYTQRCAEGRTESGKPLQRFAPRSFDTVVDTFGLCSVDDPVQVLKEMARVCRPDGKILLLEHGRAHYGWLNDKLDASAAKHQRTWGCLWNRDILAIIQEAGLRVDKLNRWHFGTSYYIVARPQ